MKKDRFIRVKSILHPDGISNTGTTVVRTGSHSECLNTPYFEEYAGTSVDHIIQVDYWSSKLKRCTRKSPAQFGVLLEKCWIESPKALPGTLCVLLNFAISPENSLAIRKEILRGIKKKQILLKSYAEFLRRVREVVPSSVRKKQTKRKTKERT